MIFKIRNSIFRVVDHSGIISKISRDPKYLAICRRVSNNHPHYKDLFQETMIILLEYDKGKIRQMHKAGELGFFVISLFMKGFQMTNSSFNKKYRHIHREINGNSTHLKQESYDIEADKKFEETIKKVQEQLHIKNDDDPMWYQNNLFKFWIKEGTISELARKTDIPRNSISDTIAKVKKRIQDEI